MPSASRTSKYRTYTIQEKRKALVLALNIDTKPAADFLNYPRRTVQDWIRQSDAIFDFKGAQTSKTLKGQGRREEVVPFAHGLLTFMKDIRRDEEPLCTTMMLEYIKTNHRCWFNNYVTGKKSIVSADNAIMRLLLRFSKRRFTPSTIYNVDETAIYFDTPAKHIWAEKGLNGSAKVNYAEKHSTRLTAVMTIRADGKMLPILFIMKGKPGGTIEMDELPNYLQVQGHIYCVQENGWMDSRVSEIYSKELLKF
ncbi:hypothetical protein PHPALM_27939 [Phytophthora palmivora]|uniref:DDE-1 domain-containing protein n=1 Tax=Phytophthora palmivora TaxID=4796 RepID=A0A2P4XBC9_9STRA|nr:hypothetical protein PHPALM_27939 [Phytophthora palmivora]